MHKHQSHHKTRQYLSIVLVAAAASLLFTPPSLGFDQTAGADDNGTPVISSPAELTIAIAQNLEPDSEVGIAAKDLGTGKEYGLGQDKTFDAASTQKVLFLAYLYHQAQDGRIDLDTKVDIKPEEVQHYGTGPLQYRSGPLSLSYRELATYMMRQSDNTAAYVLADRLGKVQIQDYGRQLGMEHNSVAENTITPADMLPLLGAIHSGQVAGGGLGEEMKGLMTDSDFEDRLAPGLPDGATLYHKTGDALGGGLHDVGIVTYGDHAYAVALFTRHVELTKIPVISRDLFAYFTR